MPCLVFLINTKELNTERSRFSQVDGAEVGGFLWEQEGWQGAFTAQSEVLITHHGKHAELLFHILEQGESGKRRGGGGNELQWDSGCTVSTCPVPMMPVTVSSKKKTSREGPSEDLLNEIQMFSHKSQKTNVLLVPPGKD